MYVIFNKYYIHIHSIFRNIPVRLAQARCAVFLCGVSQSGFCPDGTDPGGSLDVWQAGELTVPTAWATLQENRVLQRTGNPVCFIYSNIIITNFICHYQFPSASCVIMRGLRSGLQTRVCVVDGPVLFFPPSLGFSQISSWAEAAWLWGLVFAFSVV